MRECSAFLVAFGPEVRAFLHSGFIDQCAEQGEVVILTSNPESSVFLEQPYLALPLPHVIERPILTRFRTRVATVAEQRLEMEGMMKWRHAMPEGGQGGGMWPWLKRGLASDYGLRLLGKCEKVLERISTTAVEIAALFENYRIESLYYSAYGNPRTNAVIAAAKRAGVKTVCIPNSWKDFYVRPRVSPVPDSIWVWDAEVRNNYLRLNPELQSAQVEVQKSLHLAALKRHLGTMSKKQFCALYGFNAEKPIVCYTTAAPDAVVCEEKIVSELARAIQGDTRLADCQLLVRVNPMETGQRYEQVLAGLPQVAVQRPVWDWSPEKDWCCAHEEDVRLWAMTLEFMTVNVSIPSTVTLEALEFGKSVVNIRFDAEPGVPKSRSVQRFWTATFYRRFQNEPRVVCVLDNEQLIRAISGSLEQACV